MYREQVRQAQMLGRRREAEAEVGDGTERWDGGAEGGGRMGDRANKNKRGARRGEPSTFPCSRSDWPFTVLG